ncbi:MAG: hypothetical protein DLM72_20035 [Candidatus Nitrosopolaris wilkensis]|nr:MAG: hypothetical protein DLM72_20035 [Candidatus Nitrosopolaris wilkensis]
MSTDSKKNQKKVSKNLYCGEAPLVSVVVTTRNESDTIIDCITSIFEQTYPNFEVIIIDAKSSDGTFERTVELESLSRSFTNCKRYFFCSEEANSPAKGRNVGVKAAHGTILAFTDGDCVAEKDWLTNLVKYIPKNTGIVGGPNILRHFKTSKIIDTIDNVLGTYLGSGGSPQFLQIGKVSEVCGVSSCNLAIQKSLFDSIGGFNERLRYNEDSDLSNRVREKGHRIIYSPQAKVNHFMGLDSFSKFSTFVYKYGSERGKNIAHDSKLFTKINGLSITFLLTLLSLMILCFFTLVALTMLLALISFVIIILIFFSIRIAIRNRSPIFAVLAMPTYIVIFTFYNFGLVSGYFWQKNSKTI